MITKLQSTTPALLAAVLLAGCTAAYTEPALPPDHPASSGAPESPLPDRSRTLDLADAEPVSPAAQARPDHHAADETPPPDHAAPGAPRAAAYACPMHPEVTSDQPDQRCPKCGMRLTKQEGETP